MGPKPMTGVVHRQPGRRHVETEAENGVAESHAEACRRQTPEEARRKPPPPLSLWRSTAFLTP